MPSCKQLCTAVHALLHWLPLLYVCVLCLWPGLCIGQACALHWTAVLYVHNIVLLGATRTPLYSADGVRGRRCTLCLRSVPSVSSHIIVQPRCVIHPPLQRCFAYAMSTCLYTCHYAGYSVALPRHRPNSHCAANAAPRKPLWRGVPAAAQQQPHHFRRYGLHSAAARAGCRRFQHTAEVQKQQQQRWQQQWRQSWHAETPAGTAAASGGAPHFCVPLPQEQGQGAAVYRRNFQSFWCFMQWHCVCAPCDPFFVSVM
jgi:hypothetical protein